MILNFKNIFFTQKLPIIFIGLIFLFSFGMNKLYSQTNFEFDLAKNIEILNTNKDEFAPYYLKNESKLVFNSMKSGLSRIYESKDSLKDFKTPNIYNPSLNSLNENLSYFSKIDENNALISKFNSNTSSSVLSIYELEFKKMSWNFRTKTPLFEKFNFNSHSTVSPSGKIIIFTCQADKESKDLDLYISFKTEFDRWSEPVAISELNTTGNEITPYFYDDGTLFFASNGLDGQGGYDIFVSNYQNGKWGRPNPVNSINTIDDESDITFDKDNNIIFASNRAGGKGGLDLWMANPKIDNNFQSKAKDSFEIKIQSYFPNIKVKHEIEYTPVYLPQFLEFDSINSDKFNYRALIPGFTPIYNSLEYTDSLIIQTIHLFASRLIDNPNLKLKITSATPAELEQSDSQNKNSKFYSDLRLKNLLQYIEKYYEISSSKIEIAYKYYNKTNSKLDNFAMIELVGDENKIFFEDKIEKINIEPKILKIDVTGRPIDNIESWECISGLKNEPIFSSKKVPDDFLIELNNYTNYISKNEIIEFKCNAKSKMGVKVSEILSLNIISSYFNRQKGELIDGREYKYFDIFIVNQDIFEFEEIYSKLIHFFNSNFKGKSIVIEADSSNKNIRNFIDSFKNTIHAGKEIKINQTKVNSKNQILNKIRIYIEQ